MEEKEIIQAFQAFYDRHKRMPSLREVRDKILRTNSMRQSHALVKRLVEEGYFRKDSNGILQPTSAMMGIHHLGSVVAGFPSPADEETEDVLTLDEWLIKDRRGTFRLTVSGESMKDAGILSGDIIIVRRGMQPNDGDTVVAVIDGGWTVKIFRRLSGKKFALEPRNPKFKTIYPKEELRIEAVVTSVIRILK